LIGNRKAVLRAERFSVLGIDRLATRKGRGVGAHLRASLHTAVPADGHEAALVPPDPAFQQAQIQDHRNGVTAESVLGDAHAPDEHGVLRITNHLGELVHGQPVEA
jgi:hypothetical protein